MQRGLTAEMAQDPKTVEYVTAIEKSVKYYGEAELAVIDRITEDPNALDAFVVSEQLIIAFNTRGAAGRGTGSNTDIAAAPRGKLVALYPAEGAFWADHPLALLESAALGDNQRRTFQAFREYLAGAEAQKEEQFIEWGASLFAPAAEGAPAEKKAISTPSKESAFTSRTSSSTPLKGTLEPREREEARGRTSVTGNFLVSRVRSISRPTRPVAPSRATLIPQPLQ